MATGSAGVMQRLYPALRRSRQFAVQAGVRTGGIAVGCKRIGAVPVGADGAAQAAQLDESPDADGECDEPEACRRS